MPELILNPHRQKVFFISPFKQSHYIYKSIKYTKYSLFKNFLNHWIIKFYLNFLLIFGPLLNCKSVPMQIARKPYDLKIDIFSLGLILLELLIPFSTQMERIRTLQDAKRQVFPARFIRELPLEVTVFSQHL